MAGGPGLDAVRADALRLPFADRSVDLVTAVKFATTSTAPAPAGLGDGPRRRAPRRRASTSAGHWLAYWGFVAWSRVFTANRLVRYDGPLSVLRGFTAGELADLGEPLPAFRGPSVPTPGSSSPWWADGSTTTSRKVSAIHDRVAQPEGQSLSSDSCVSSGWP